MVAVEAKVILDRVFVIVCSRNVIVIIVIAIAYNRKKRSVYTLWLFLSERKSDECSSTCSFSYGLFGKAAGNSFRSIVRVIQVVV